METYITLYKPFLLGIFQDICDLYPEEISADHKHGINNILEVLKPLDVINLCKIGKMIEKSVITGNKLPLADFPTEFSSKELGDIFYNEDGFPRLLENCFERCFRRDGTPTWHQMHMTTSSFEDSVGRNGIIIDYQSTIRTPQNEGYALAMTCLRQLYVGCSKLRNWECLRRRNFGDQLFCYTSEASIARTSFFRPIKTCETTSERFISIGRSRYLVSVC